MVFFGSNNHHLAQASKQPLQLHQIICIQFTWQFQKNGIKGETKTYSRDNNTNPLNCIVCVALRICDHFLSFNNLPHNHPITIYRASPTSKTTYLIKASNISKYLCLAAQHVYQISAKFERIQFLVHTFYLYQSLHYSSYIGHSQKRYQMFSLLTIHIIHGLSPPLPEGFHIMCDHINCIWTAINDDCPNLTDEL